MRYFLLAFAIVISGCASWYSEEPNTIQITVVQNAKALPPSCKKLGSFEGDSCWDSRLALLDLKKKSGDVEASHLVLTKSDFGFWCQKYYGDAYRCH